MDELIGMRTFIQGIHRNLPLWAENLPDFPMLVYETINQYQTPTDNLKQINRELINSVPLYSNVINISLGC